MPNGQTHSALTRDALELQIFETGDNAELIRDYCSFPDRYFSDRRTEIEPYTFMLDGIQFHYPPHIAYEDLYRYWDCDEKQLFRARPFRNENFRHVTEGFRWYIQHIVDRFRRGETEEGKKFLGCLLHMLEDSTFGLHALEGPGGSDAFILDRLSESSVPPSFMLAKIRYRDDFPRLEYTPRSLGNSVEEMVMKLYAAYCAAASDSRRAAFRYVLNTLENRADENPALEERMRRNAVTLCADVIRTVFQLAKGEKLPRREPCKLDELEPYEFPFGGFGAYCYRSFVRNAAAGPDGAVLPLELDSGRAGHGLSFGTHSEGALRYWIAPETFREFSVRIGLHPAFPARGKIELKLFNDGQEVRSLTLDNTCRSAEIRIADPRNEFGLAFRSTSRCGVVVLADPLLTYREE